MLVKIVILGSVSMYATTIKLLRVIIYTYGNSNTEICKWRRKYSNLTPIS